MIHRVAVEEIPVEENEIAAEGERRRDDPQAGQARLRRRQDRRGIDRVELAPAQAPRGRLAPVRERRQEHCERAPGVPHPTEGCRHAQPSGQRDELGDAVRAARHLVQPHPALHLPHREERNVREQEPVLGRASAPRREARASASTPRSPRRSPARARRPRERRAGAGLRQRRIGLASDGNRIFSRSAHRLRPMNVGILTGGGDCPGLNAVIRAVARRSFDRGHEVTGIRAGWRGLVENELTPLKPPDISGLLPRGGTILGTSRTNPYKQEGGVELVLADLRQRGPGRARRDRRRGHARRRGEALRGARVPGRRRAEDDRQRPLRDRLHLRLRHGGLDRDRGDRPAAHDRRVAQPRHGRRGDGPAHRLDRGDERHRRRRRRDPHPRAAS